MDAVRLISELRTLEDLANEPEIRREGPRHTAWRAKADALIRAGLGDDSPTLTQFRAISYSIGVWFGVPGEAEANERHFDGAVSEALALIEAAIFEIEIISHSTNNAGHFAVSERGSSVFIVHGRNDARKYELVRLLERTMLEAPVILHEQASMGATILEKLENHAKNAAFAAILLTADDEGRLRDGVDRDLLPRGRQNVIFEAGVFMGILGRSKVALLVEEDMDRPSDLDGLMYIPLDSAGAWRYQLLKEVSAAGLTVDATRVP